MVNTLSTLLNGLYSLYIRMYKLPSPFLLSPVWPVINKSGVGQNIFPPIFHAFTAQLPPKISYHWMMACAMADPHGTETLPALPSHFVGTESLMWKSFVGGFDWARKSGNAFAWVPGGDDIGQPTELAGSHSFESRTNAAPLFLFIHDTNTTKLCFSFTYSPKFPQKRQCRDKF